MIQTDYNTEADSLTLWLAEGAIAARSEVMDSEILDGLVVLHLDADDRVVGIELMDASTAVTSRLMKSIISSL